MPVGAARSDLNITRTRLSDALLALGQQLNLNIGGRSGDLDHIWVHPLHGRFSAEQALRRLLMGTGLTFVQIDASTYRIVHAPNEPRRSRIEPSREWPPVTGPAIVVTGSKRSVPLSRYPATVDVVELERFVEPITGASASANLVATMPMLASTHFGRGRNKLFIRGIADSSFSGPTQATSGQYLGDVRLNYNEPDPDLGLYDIARVEVIEGPQGTLYGAGTLGGVIRLIPNVPDIEQASAKMSAGISWTQNGAASTDAAAMLNLPVIRGLAGLRAVVYRDVEGGYIDDSRRALSDINRMRVNGGRLTLRIEPASHWMIDVGAAFQWIATRDSQYTDLDQPPLTRQSAVAQPFDNDYQLWHATVQRSGGLIDITSASGLVIHDVSAYYDATPPDASLPIRFSEQNSIRLFTHETRLSHRPIAGGGWVIGLALVDDVDRVRRDVGPPGREVEIAALRNSTFEASLFGEIAFPLTPYLSATLGARATLTHLSGEPLATAGAAEFEPDRDSVRALPTIALAWRPQSDLLVFSRYQQGYRAGGLNIAKTAAGPAIQHFKADKISSAEAGLRVGENRQSGLTGSATISYARWRNIQADLIEPGSLPSTANIGKGEIVGFEGSGRWDATPNLAASAAVFLNHSSLVSPAVGFEEDAEDLPNIAKTGIAGSIQWHRSLAASSVLAFELTGRYVGKSQLGVGPGLDLEQGRYVECSVVARLSMKRLKFTWGISNLANVRANRFALGNPFGSSAGRQATPLRPRTIRMGVESAF